MLFLLLCGTVRHQSCNRGPAFTFTIPTEQAGPVCKLLRVSQCSRFRSSDDDDTVNICVRPSSVRGSRKAEVEGGILVRRLGRWKGPTFQCFPVWHLAVRTIQQSVVTLEKFVSQI